MAHDWMFKTLTEIRLPNFECLDSWCMLESLSNSQQTRLINVPQHFYRSSLPFWIPRTTVRNDAATPRLCHNPSPRSSTDPPFSGQCWFGTYVTRDFLGYIIIQSEVFCFDLFIIIWRTDFCVCFCMQIFFCTPIRIPTHKTHNLNDIFAMTAMTVLHRPRVSSSESKAFFVTRIRVRMGTYFCCSG